jgi:hypothetical protein
MRTKEAIKLHLAYLDEQINKLYATRKEVETELAECLKLFSVGDRVITEIKTFNGKVKDVIEYEIIAVGLWCDKPRYTGRKVLKSGALHKNSVVIWGELKAKEAGK